MPEFNQKYYIVKEHPLRIIDKCKSHSKGTLMSFLVGICVLFFFSDWIPELLGLVFPVTSVDLLSGYEVVDHSMLRSMPSTPVVFMIYSALFSGVFEMGKALYALTYIRNRRVEIRALAEGLPYYIKTLEVALLRGVIIVFWSMFFVVPGLLAAINFSQAYYILADDPSKSVTQVLAESKIMMYGNRMSYVKLLFYYLPYMMLAYVPVLLMANLTSTLELSVAALTAVALIAELPLFIADGYVCLGRTVFYELMINKGFAYFRYAGQDAFREYEKLGV